MTERRRFEIPVAELDGVRVAQADQMETAAEARLDEPWVGQMSAPDGAGANDADGD